MTSDLLQKNPIWSNFIFDKPARPDVFVIGVLEGEGVGPEVIGAALKVLTALESQRNLKFERLYGGLIGKQALSEGGKPLSQDVIDWCQGIFDQRGAVLCGPGGDRFVYDLRRCFDLFCKLVPLKHYKELGKSGRLKPEYTKDIDILLIRENVSGIYQGQWSETSSSDEGRKAEHTFSYTEKTIRRLLKVAVGISSQRRKEITVVIKDSGVPSISKLWRDCSTDEAERAGIKCSFINFDHAAYSLIQHGQEFDVIVAPNLAGDVIGDLGAVLMGSRALPCSGNFSAPGAAVYQTCHGTGYDLLGKNLANPAAQILSLSMLLKESFGLIEEAQLVEDALRDVWRQGWRTFDLMEPGYRPIGTQEMGDLVAETLIELAKKAQ